MRDEIWTVAEVAERWKVSANTVCEMLRKGELKGFKIRMNWRIQLSEILRYETEQDPRTMRRPTPTVQPMPKPVVLKIR